MNGGQRSERMDYQRMVSGNNMKNHRQRLWDKLLPVNATTAVMCHVGQEEGKTFFFSFYNIYNMIIMQLALPDLVFSTEPAVSLIGILKRKYSAGYNAAG